MRKIILGLLALTIAGFVVGYYLSYVYECGYSIFCANLLTKAHALYFGMGSLAFVFLVLSIFPHAFNAWKKFALWFLPLAIDQFISYKGPSGGFMDPLPNPESIYRWIGGFYIVISLTIIAASFFLKKFGKKQPVKVYSKKGKIIFWTLWVVYVGVILVWYFFD